VSASPAPARVERGPAYALVAVLALAAVLRLSAVLLLGDVPRGHGDEGYYISAARSLVRGDGYPGSVRPPGFPLFMAGVMAVFGQGLTAVRVAQVGVSLLAVALVFALVRRRYGTSPAAVSALLVAIQPELVHYTHFLWSETLVATLLLGVFWTLERFEERGREAWLAGAGALLGYTILTREMLLYFAPIVVLWMWWREKWSVRRTVRPAIVFAVPIALVVLPWTARNYLVQGHFVLVSTTRWLPIAQGNVLPAHGSALDLGWSREIARRYSETDDEIAREELARTEALRAIRAQQPTWILRKLQRNTYLLLTPSSQMARFVTRGWFGKVAQPIVERLVSVEGWVYVLLTIIGLAALWLVPDQRTKPLIVGLLLVHFAIYTVANANHRFRLPLQPFLLLYAGPLLLGWAQPPSRARWRWAGAGLCVAIFVSIVTVHLLREGSMGVTRKPPRPRRVSAAARDASDAPGALESDQRARKGTAAHTR